MTRERKSWNCRRPKGPLCLLALIACFLSLPTPGAATEIIFLQDGRTIQAEGTEIIGDRIRIEKSTKTIELPRTAVLSIHPVSPPTASSNAPPPAEVYRDLTRQMTDKVRTEIQNRPPVPVYRGR
jgi:hypothetical protein